MTILSAQSIRARTGMISPFSERTTAHGMTYGLGPAGYDVRIREHGILWPGEFMLASTIEAFAIPDDVIAFAKDKSSWARQGLSAFNTVLEPGWTGTLTLELVNLSKREIRLREAMPIAQIVFQLLDEPTALPYRGKYQHQPAAPVPAILEGV